MHFAGAQGAPGTFVNMYVHMLSMMNYMGFHEVIGKLKWILRIFARCLQPDSDVPKYIPGPPDSDDEDDNWTMEVPEPGVLPPRPLKKYVTPVSRPSSAATTTFAGQQQQHRAARAQQQQHRAAMCYRR